MSWTLEAKAEIGKNLLMNPIGLESIICIPRPEHLTFQVLKRERCILNFLEKECSSAQWKWCAKGGG